jgi:hypothetical protein
MIVTYTAVFQYEILDGHLLATEEKFSSWLEILSLSTMLFPFLSIFLLRATKLISDAFMHSPADRVLPLTVTLFFYVWAFYFFQAQPLAPLYLRSLLLGSVFSIIVDFAINFFYKVSVHTTAVAVMPASILVMMWVTGFVPVPVLLITILLATLIGIVRWLLGSHTLGQIILGYLVGFTTQIAAWYLLKTF